MLRGTNGRAPRSLLSVWRFNQGKWCGILVDIAPANS